nr:MAG TPA: Lysozyme-like protein [Caudoviricetes sp.]
MKKINTKKIVIIIAVAILAYLVFTAFRKPASKRGSNEGDKDEAGTDTSRAGFPLKYGSRGKYVKALQRWLNGKKAEGVANFGANLVVDGKFGDKTLSALRVIWEKVEGYPVRELNELQYLANNIHLYETLN